MSKVGKMFEVREIKTGKHIDFIKCNSKDEANAVFTHPEARYFDEHGHTNFDLHECTVKTPPVKTSFIL